MFTTAFATLLGAALIVVPGMVKAWDTEPYRPTYIQAAPAPALRPVSGMDLTPHKPLVRPYGRAGFDRDPGATPTAINYRLAPDGPVGSIGFVRLDSSHAIDPTMLSNAVSNQPGAPDQTVGAAVRYAFR